MKLYLPDKFTELCIFTCKEPIYIDIYHVDRQLGYVYFTWDFGMDAVVSLRTYISKHRKGLKKKVFREIIFDVGHAFCHCSEDPNYTEYHWALRGWLKDRLEVHEPELIYEIKR
jgi:hypothetical protein